MALFRKKKDRVLDLTERYRKQLDAETQKSAAESAQQSTGFDFFGNAMPTPTAQAQPREESEGRNFELSSVEDRRRKLGKRLVEMTNKLEELSNQIYHLQQRVEVLERKAGVMRE